MDKTTFKKELSEYLSSEKILEMQNYIQHRDLNLLEHSIHVSYVSWKAASKLNLDQSVILKGAILHDFFLYDWHLERHSEKMHGFAHPEIALGNAKQHFDLSPIEEDIILKHMWPLTLSPPKHKASMLVCLVDKYCSFMEIISPSRRSQIKARTRSLLEGQE